MSSITPAPVSTGVAHRIMKAITYTVQGKSGIFIHVMPGARMRVIVTMKLIAPISDEVPTSATAISHRSVP